MAEKHFRVLLDLTDLHEQNFKYVWINVSPRELKTISDFEKSILNKLNLKQKCIELFVRDGLLLDEETILVLREDDTVKVCYKKQHSNFDHDDDPRTSSRKRNHSESSADAIAQHSKRQKSESECFESSKNEEKQSRKKKNKKSQTLSLDIHENNSAVLEENSVTKKKNNKDKSSVKSDHNAPLTKKDEAFFSFDITEPLLKQNENIKHSSLKKKKNVCKKSVLLEPEKEINSVSDSLLNNNKTDCLQNEKVNENKVPEKKITTECSEEQSSVRPKRKRKRHRKRKTVSQSPIDILDKTSADNEFKSFSQSTDVNDKKKHIIYSSSSDEIQVGRDDASQLQSCSNTFTVKEDNFVSHNQSTFNYPKVSTPAQSDSCGNPNWCVSLMQNGKQSADGITSNKTKLDKSSGQLSQEKVVFSFSENNESQNSNIDILQASSSMEINENEHSLSESCSSQNNKAVSKNLSFLKERRNTSYLQNGSTSHDFIGDRKSINKENTEEKHMTSDKKYEEFPTLNCLPEVGTRIAYKILELDENYSPVISDYREGVVKSVNLKTEELEIELSKEIIKPGRTGKFENLKEDEIPSPDVITCDVTRWSSIISPKCLL